MLQIVSKNQGIIRYPSRSGAAMRSVPQPPDSRAFMRLLKKQCIVSYMAARLRSAGHDVVHVRDRGMQGASDAEILETAERERRIIVSADTDFGALLTLRSKRLPSFILLRRQRDRSPAKSAEVLVDLLDRVADELKGGSIVVVEDDRVRIRQLPVRGN